MKLLPQAAIKTFSGTGNFSTPANWGGTIPSAGDDIIIASGASCTIDTASAKSFGNLTITGSLFNSAANAPISINGSLVNNGTFTAGTGSVTFTGATSNTITGSAVTAFGNGGLIINKGVSSANVLDVQSVISIAGSLTLTNGVFKLSSASTLTVFNGNITIPASAGLWCNSASASITTQNGNLTVAGLLEVTAGTLTVGTQAANILIPASTGSIVVGGGNLNVAGNVSNTGVSWTFSMTAGTMTFNTNGSAAGGLPFNMDTTGCSFSMSGGTIVVQQAGTGSPSFKNLATSGTGSTGGVLQIGNASTGTQTIGILSTRPIYALVVNSANVTAQLTTSALTVTTDVTITAGLVNANNLNLTVGGTWTNNTATTAFTAGTATVTMNGAAAEFIAGTFATTFNNLTIAGSNVLTSSVNCTVSSNLTVTSGTLDLGSFTANRGVAGGTLTVSNGAKLKIGGTNTIPANYSTHSIGATSTIEYGGTNQSVVALNSVQDYGNLTISGSGTKTLSGSENVNGTLTLTAGALSIGANTLTISGLISTTSGTLTGGGSSNLVIAGAGASTTLPSVTVNNLTMNRAAGITLGGNVTASGVITFTSGNIPTGANTLYNSTGTVSRTSGYVVGNFKKNVAVGTPSNETFEIGDATNYTPMTVAFASVSVAGDLTASTVAGDHANIGTSTINAAKSVNRTWTLTNSGVTFTTYGATFTFVAGDLDAGATTSAFIVGKYLAGWTYPTVGTKTALTTQTTGLTTFGAFQLGEVFVANMTWDGGAGTSNWGDANNWNTNVVPVASDNVDLTGANTININVAAVATNLLLNNAGLVLTINSANSLDVSGALTLTSGTLNMGTNTISGAGSFTLGAGGNLGIGSTAGITSSGATGNVQVTGTRTFSTAANYTYNGTSAQVTGSGLPATVNNLTINNSAGVTLTATVAVSSDLTVTAGTFDLGSFTTNRASAGGTLTVSSGATLKIGGTNGFPTNYSTNTLGVTSTVDYSGTAEAVGAQNYGHLTLSNSGAKTFAATTIGIAGTFTISGTATANMTANSPTVDYNGGGSQTILAQTYYNLTASNSGTKTLTGTAIVNNNLAVSNTAVLDLSSFTADRASAGGTLSVASGATLKIGGTNTLPSNYSTHSIGANSTIEYSGTNQALAVLNSSQDYGHLTISGSGTKTLAGSVNVGGTLTFASATITTGASTLYLKTGGTVSRTSGQVIGNFKKNIATGATSKTFEVGDAANYTPVDIAFVSVSTAGDLTSSVASGDHANIGTSTINAAKSVNRNWTLTNGGIVFTSYGATFTFVAGDLDAGTTTSAFIVGKYSAGWSYSTVGAKTSTTTQTTGLTAFGAFQLGEAVLPPDVPLANSVLPSGTQPPGTDLVYTVVFTNGGGQAAQVFIVIDPIPANTDFKLGSQGTDLGTTGMTVAIGYSNDSAATWTYTPVSGGGGAPAGYDRAVTHVRWSFTGNLSRTSPNNAGSVTLTTRIR